MPENLKALSAIPVFGFEWGGCHFKDKDDDKLYINRNLLKAAGYIPIVNFVTGALMIAMVGGSDDLGKEKKATFIVRGIVTILSGGIPLALADLAVTVGRIASRKPHEVVA